jgi:hypothetical protein
MIDNFLSKGHIYLNDSNAFKYIDIHNVQWSDPGCIGLSVAIKDQELKNQLVETQTYLAKKYVKEIDNNYKISEKIDLVNGMDKATLEWHNDMIIVSNLCVLMYFDSMDEDIGGAIQFRNTKTKELINSYYPKQHDIVIMNQSEQFEHMVTSLKIKMPRKVASFHYFVNKNLTNI